MLLVTTLKLQSIRQLMKFFVKLHDGSLADFLWTMQSHWVRCFYIVTVANSLFLTFIIYFTFLKKIQKKVKHTKQRRSSEKNLHNIILIWQYKMKLQQNYFCTKKRQKIYFLYKS